ncbi:hypothetical protein F4677DRAFT_333930 [Hypoxylon crocopeplum]|nr:hypothetical protein F4677DRAFT_333930 [Hypoxylon crocopeplum]
MTLSNEAIVGIIALLIMCIPGLRFLIRILRRHKARPKEENTVIPLEPILRPDDLGLLEGGMVYSTRTVRVETLMVRLATMPNFRWTFSRRGSELSAANDIAMHCYVIVQGSIYHPLPQRRFYYSKSRNCAERMRRGYVKEYPKSRGLVNRQLLD